MSQRSHDEAAAAARETQKRRQSAEFAAATGPALSAETEGNDGSASLFRHLPPKKRAFLEAYARTGSKSTACVAIGIPTTTPYNLEWRKDEAFQALVPVAEAMYGDVLEAEISRRAVDGVEKPAGWYKGAPGGYVREYSDLLLIFKAKGVLPDKYKDRVELRGALAHLDLSRLTDEQVARMAAGEHPLAVLGGAVSAAEPVRALPAGEAGKAGQRDIVEGSKAAIEG